jgi:hypothetical protein
MLKFPLFSFETWKHLASHSDTFRYPLVVATHRLGNTDLQNGERNLNACKTPKLEIPLS